MLVNFGSILNLFDTYSVNIFTIWTNLYVALYSTSNRLLDT